MPQVKKEVKEPEAVPENEIEPPKEDVKKDIPVQTKESWFKRSWKYIAYPILVIIFGIIGIFLFGLFGTYIANIKDPEYQLKKYIKKNLKDGFTKTEIKKEILKNSWPKKEVDRIFRELNL